MLSFLTVTLCTRLMLSVYEIFYSFILSLIDCICTPIDIVANVRTCDGEYINIKIIEYKILK
ncbi:hypothetical protein XR17_03345 [Salmonella enterica subsp. enterica]|uniref:Uncharacterized protein n=8 Tax=Salmonella enterica I TaxID=59201 RepID=A0A3U7XLL6_SALMU|nr:hypothetical protein LFZ46_10475 [Salmonella enterica subsp. enterica serovar Yovokome str. S-1850]ASO49140.1 hypothetical protein CHD73_19155 [Salmonella enterica subsp. enterica serovar Manhattan]EAA5434391.1 hypothetical protein [Salmonella enterica subsp. enterica serovar Muenchen]EAM3053429.1 hypothetical protein [Salmonella enterica]EBD0159238.1 hypothetical protein [Salmonella enterica subsp. enterica serovar Newport]MID49147.1 hypothetical protein [Salmonella enterica subsp. enteric